MGRREPLVADAGTDGATVVFLDPAAQPSDFDARMREDPIATLEAMMEEGRAFWANTGSDGGFLLHVYVDAPLPEPIAAVVHDCVEIPEFVVESGSVLFAGAEYAYRDDDRMMRRYPGMGSFVEILPGRYRFAAWRTEWPDDIEEVAEASVNPAENRARRLFNGLMACTVAATFALIGSCATGNIQLVSAAGVLVFALGVAARIVHVSPAKKRGDAAFERIERSRPSIVIRLETIDLGERELA